MRWLPPPTLLALLTMALPALAAQQPRDITPTPSTDFGGAMLDSDPAAELLEVRDVMRLDDGRFVVVNGKPSEVRLYDQRGRLVRRISRSGSGPGEYRGQVRILPWPGDTIRLWASGTRRWMLFTPAGRLVREWPTSDQAPPPPTNLFLRGSAVVFAGIIGSSGCPAGALTRLAPREAVKLTDAVADPAGRYWLRPFRGRTWSVYDRGGELLARIGGPADFRITQFDGTEVIGVRIDDDGFSHVVVFESGLPPGQVAVADCDHQSQPLPAARSAAMRTTLRNAMTVAEAYYARHDSYPRDADAFPREMTPDGMEFTVQTGGATSYSFTVTDRATGWRCLVTVGSENPALDGVLLCGG